MIRWTAFVGVLCLVSAPEQEMKMTEQDVKPPKKKESVVVLGLATVGMFVGAATLRVVGADYYQARLPANSTSPNSPCQP